MPRNIGWAEDFTMPAREPCQNGWDEPCSLVNPKVGWDEPCGSSNPPTPVSPIASAEIGNVGDTIIVITFTGPVGISGASWSDGWTVLVNGAPVTFSAVQTAPNQITIILTTPAVNGDVVTISYDAAAGTIYFIGTGLSIGNIPSTTVTNNVPVHTFVPTDVTGMFAWHDFSDITTLFQDAARTTPVAADADLIGGVTDKSGAANYLSVVGVKYAVYKTSIRNGKSIGRWDDSALKTPDFSTINQPCTYFYVIARTASILDGAYSGVMDGNDGSKRHLAAYPVVGDPVPGRFLIYSGVTFVKTQSSIGTSFHLVTIGFDDTKSFIRVDGIIHAIGESGNQSIAGFGLGCLLGGTSPFRGDIGECLAYQGVITLQNIRDIENYLATKWAFTLPPEPLPAAIPNITTWLSTNTIPYDEGVPSSIFSWGSQHGFPYNGNRAISVPALERPYLNYNVLNGLAAEHLNGIGNCIGLPNTVDLMTPTSGTVFIVFRANSIPAADGYGGAYPIYSHGIDNSLLVGNTNQVMRSQWGTHVRQTISAGTWYILETGHGDGTMFISVNGGADVSASGVTNIQCDGSQFLFGADTNPSLDCDVAEIIFANRALTSTERTAIRNYLNAKWDVY